MADWKTIKSDNREKLGIEKIGAEKSAPINRIQPIKSERKTDSRIIETEKKIDSKISMIEKSMEDVLELMVGGEVTLENVINFVILETQYRIQLNGIDRDIDRVNQWVKLRKELINMMG